jgi:flagellar biosynthesis protein FlhG
MNQGLFRFHLDRYRSNETIKNVKARVISVASGKGGVGKTFFTTNFARYLGTMNKKVLLIDCDVYLSNCYLSLGVTPRKDLFDLMEGDSFSDCITNVGGIDLVSGRSGNEDGHDGDYVQTILSLIQSLEYTYDYILLDCPAGIDSRILSLMAYSDERVVLLNPNKYSLTDAYSVVKTLRKKYGVKSFNTVVNKCSAVRDAKDVNRRLLGTCLSFLPDVKIRGIGQIPLYSDKQNFSEEFNSTCKELSNIFQLLHDNGLEGSDFCLQNNLEMEFQVSF